MRSASFQPSSVEEGEATMAAPARNPNRAQMQSGVSSYKIVPKNVMTSQPLYARPVGASGDDKFRRMKARQMGKVVGKK